MSNHHIRQLLEERSLTSLSAAELKLIAAHTAVCDECLSAYEAAQIAFAMLQERTAVVVEPPPFFQTRVMAAIRERNQTTNAFGFVRMWQAAKTLLASMAALVVLLMTLTIYTSDASLPASSDSAISLIADPAELVIYERDSFDEQEITNSQVLSDLYSIEVGDSNGK